ncbi:MAG: hypothetical protein M1825_000923 [Sarcosagium campestre]|nr:MAG: hypothetical protein M1825_000923 [Sarcosagium campestre]
MGKVDSKDSQAIGQFINGILEAQPLQWQWRPGIATGVGFARENVWSRASRRRKTPHKDTDASMHDTETSDEDEEEPALGFRIDVREITESGHTGVTIRWLKGKDSVLFESFCGMLKRKVETTIYGT